jgi:hypothetical protein
MSTIPVWPTLTRNCIITNCIMRSSATPRFSWGDSTELEDERVSISTLCDYDGAIDCGDRA